DLPIDGYDRNDVKWLCAPVIRLRKMREEGAAEGALILVPTLDKVAAAQSDPCLIKTSNDLCKGKV
ncbi:hypothetical protein Tco_0279376, partial [Tanacetum coccineum]